MQDLRLHPEVASGIPPFGLIQFVLDGPDEQFEPPVPQRRERHLHQVGQFPAQGLEGIPMPAKMQLEAQQLRSHRASAMDGGPQCQLPGFRIKTVQEQVAEMRAHGPRLAAP